MSFLNIILFWRKKKTKPLDLIDQFNQNDSSRVRQKDQKSVELLHKDSDVSSGAFDPGVSLSGGSIIGAFLFAAFTVFIFLMMKK